MTTPVLQEVDEKLIIQYFCIYGINVPDGNGRTILHLAVIENKTEYVQILRKEGLKAGIN